MIIAPLSKRYSVGMDGVGRNRMIKIYIQPRCVSVVAFVFLIELGNVAGLIGDMNSCFSLNYGKIRSLGILS